MIISDSQKCYTLNVASRQKKSLCPSIDRITTIYQPDVTTVIVIVTFSLSFFFFFLFEYRPLYRVLSYYTEGVCSEF